MIIYSESKQKSNEKRRLKKVKVILIKIVLEKVGD